jgi:hypothetical protein
MLKAKLIAVQAAMLLIIVLLVSQMWLLTATLEAYLDGHTEVAMPAAIFSATMFLSCFGLYRFVTRLDRR